MVDTTLSALAAAAAISGRPQPRIVEFETDPGLKVLQDTVASGGLIQLVLDFTTYNGRACDVVVDEEGLYKNPVVNLAATKAWRDDLTARYGADAWDPAFAVLVGDVAVIYGGLK